MDRLLTAMQWADKLNFCNRAEYELYINACARPERYNVLFSQGKPMVIDGRVRRMYNEN